jgi:DNA end-binding protein Ku
MAPRAQWNGFLRLSLVSCAVSLYPAISPAERIGFRQVNRETGNRLRQQLVDTVTGQIVANSDRGRGYEVGEEQFLIVPDEELKAAQLEARTRPFTHATSTEPEKQPSQRPVGSSPRAEKRGSRGAEGSEPQRHPEPVAAPPPPRPIVENTHTIELDRFVPQEEIDARYLLAPYYLAPRDEISLEAYSVIRDAMAQEGLVGLGRVVLSNRERPLIVQPAGVGLRAFTLHYAHEIRPEADYYADIRRLELPHEILDLTELILNSKREHFDPTYLEDRYRTVMVEKLREKTALSRKKVPEARPSAQNVVNLMEALKASLGTSKPPAASKGRDSGARHGRSQSAGSGSKTGRGRQAR